MNRILRKRMLSVILVLSMIMTLLPTNVLAAGDYKPYGELPEKVTINGQTFYDIYGGAKTGRKDTSSQLDFYADVIKNHDVLANWSGLAYEIYRDLPGSYTGYVSGSFDEKFGSASKAQFDLIDALVTRKSRHNTGSGSGNNAYKSSGLSVANSLKEVQNSAGVLLHDTLDRHMTGEDFAKHNPIDALDDKNEQLVLYSMAAGVDHNPIHSTDASYYLFGIAFYDFKLSVLIDDEPYNAAYGDRELEDAIEHQKDIPGFSYSYNADPARTKKSSLTNETSGETPYTQTVGESSTVTVANTITNSATYTFGESITAGANFEVKFSPIVSGGASVQTGFTAQQAMTTAYGKEKTQSKTNDASYSTTVTLQPHTAIDVISEGGEGKMTTSYDCPVAISYKVVVFSMKGSIFDSFATNYFPVTVPQTTFQTVFGSDIDSSDAITNLYNRVLVKQVNNYDTTYGKTKLAEYGTGGTYKKTLSSTLNWDSIIKKGKPSSSRWNRLGNATEIATNLTKERPMSVTGGSMSQTMSYSSTVVKDMEALYPLKNVKPAGEELGYTLDVGDKIPVDNIVLKGSNEKGVAYYGFNSDHGKWSVVDANGLPLSGTIATMRTDPLSGQVALVAVGPGSGRLTYTIEDDYYYYHGSKTPTNSKDVKAPFIAFTVKPPVPVHFDGIVEATGEITLTVGAEPVNIGDIETVDASVYDSRDKEIDVDIVWEARESQSKGIAVENNMIRVSKAGTFHVRATYQDAYSNWIDVYAQPAPVAKDQAELTRGDIVMLLHKLIGGEGITGNTGFKDIDLSAMGSGKYYNQAVAWALQNGIATGYTKEYFGVAETITKEQFIHILYNFANYLDIDTEAGTSQAIQEKIEEKGVSLWARKAIAWALSRGIITEADLEMLKGTITIDYAANIIIPVAEEGGLPAEGEMPEEEFVPPEDDDDADITQEDEDASSADGEDNGGAAEGDAQ